MVSERLLVRQLLVLMLFFSTRCYSTEWQHLLKDMDKGRAELQRR